MQLDSDQREIARHRAGRAMCAAVPGAGKTATLTELAANLLADGSLAPAELHVVTFTRSAARTFAERLAARCGRQVADAVPIRTFHAHAHHWLAEAPGVPREWRQAGTALADERQTLAMWHEVLGPPSHSCPMAIGPLEIDVAQLRGAIAKVRARGEDPAEAAGLAPVEKAAWAAYAELKATRRLMDFDELIERTIALLRHPTLGPWLRARVRAVLLDEAQDTNAAQMRVLELLDPPLMFFVGDPHQSIYGFQVAVPGVLSAWAERSSDLRRYRLARSYRCPSAVAAAATALLRLGGDAETTLMPVRDGGVLLEAVCADQAAEAELVANEVASLASSDDPPSVLVLARVATDLEPVSALLWMNGVPHELAQPTGFFGLPEIDGLLDAARLVLDPADMVAACRLAAYPPSRRLHLDTLLRLVTTAGGPPAGYAALADSPTDRGQYARLLVPVLAAGQDITPAELYDEIAAPGRLEAFCPPAIQERAEETIADFRTIAKRAERLEDLLALAAATRQRAQATNKPRPVRLSTIHAAKGAEADVVIVIATEEGRLPHSKSNEDKDGEERRLCYVATTRSANVVLWTRALVRGRRKPAPSRYLEELRACLPITELEPGELRRWWQATRTRRPGR